MNPSDDLGLFASRVLPRPLVLGAVVACALVLLFTGGRWLLYRHTHVVSRRAVVRGVISSVGARFDGQVASVRVRPGERVPGGSVIARLEDDRLRAETARRAAELAQSERQLGLMRLRVEHERARLGVEAKRSGAELSAASEDVGTAGSRLVHSDRERKRVNALLSAGVVSESLADEIRAKAAVDGARTAASRARRDVAEHAVEAASVALDGVRVQEREIDVLEAHVEVARARLAAANADLEATELRAPEDAWVAEVLAGPGSSVRVGQPVVLLWLVDRVWLEAWVAEDVLGEIQPGTAAEVSLPAYGGGVMRGRVRAIGIPGTEEDGTHQAEESRLLEERSEFRVRIEMETHDAPLIPGMTALVGIRRASGGRGVERIAHRLDRLLRSGWASPLAVVTPGAGAPRSNRE